MSGNISDFALVGATPLNQTSYTTGSGTFTPQAGTTWLLVTLVPGGAGGNSTSGATNCVGGRAGVPIRKWVKNTLSSYSYAVGAGGAGATSGNGTAGGDTTFGTLTAYGAQSGGPNPTTAGNTFCGESSGYGKGGTFPGGNASGFGAGGGGTSGSNTMSGNGSGGRIDIEEF